MANTPIIIGSGIGGLSIAWHLAKYGFPPLVLEKSKIGGGATGASAGMIVPAYELQYTERKLRDLFVESAHLYPEFVRAIEQESAQEVDYHQKGGLFVGIDSDDEGELERYFQFQKGCGFDVEALNANQTRKIEPKLSPQIAGSVYAKNEAWVDSIKLTSALHKACEKRGVKFTEQTEALEVAWKGNQVCGVQTQTQFYSSEKVVVATGIDLPKNLSTLGLPLLRPIKGQALEVRTQKLGLPLFCTLRSLHRYPVYLVPRSDGRIFIGATSEDVGFDSRITVEGMMELLWGATRVIPEIETMELTRSWVGFRPTTSDHLPILGPTSIDGLSVALGLYRHGILMAPWVGKQIAKWVLEENNEAALKPYFWNRT